ncbi:predicted protein [Chaetoceros tenuissimus]|uniref:Uncharacterized protein n=1 Tax=Chaetoceros tenuissimus TaxID=426638 RepID=A0AAD3D2Q5_9STRA|nr:predicted protein [Chaetoceros tenuissimus]
MNKKYKDMRRSCVKVTYNSMGERVQTKMRLSKKQKVSREKCKSCKPQPVQTFRKEQPVNEIDPMSSPALIWAVDILRDVLFGKIFRDVLAPSTMKTMDLHDILRFFFQSTFGATEIAIKRQMDLFQTILVHQQYSAFFRVAKRLVGIPGIQMFHPTVSAIYLEVWAWLFRENALQSMDCGRKVLVERNTLLEALEAVMFSGGNSFPLKLRSAIRDEISKDENECIDLDDAMENVLKCVEELDGLSRKVEEAIFKKKHMVSVAHSQSKFDGQSSLGVSTLKLAHLKKLFEMAVFLDSARIGLLTAEKVITLLLSWFQDCWNVVDLEKTELTRLLQHFEYEDNEEAIDYVLLLGVMYMFVLDCIDEDPLPHVLEAYLQEYRGTDEEDIDDIVKYVDGVRLKLDKSQLSMRATTNTCVTNARRSMSTLRPFPSNFITRWIMKPERDVFEREEMRKPQVQVMKRDQHSLQKPVLHCKNAELKIQANYVKGDISESSFGDHASNEDVGSDDEFKNPFGESIYIRFPGVEPYRRPLACQNRPNNSTMNRKSSFKTSSVPVKDDDTQICERQISRLRSRYRVVDQESSRASAQEKCNLAVDPVGKRVAVDPIEEPFEDVQVCSLDEKVNKCHDFITSNLVDHEKSLSSIKSSEKVEVFSDNEDARDEEYFIPSETIMSRKPVISQEDFYKYIAPKIAPKTLSSKSLDQDQDMKVDVPHLIAGNEEENDIYFESFPLDDQPEAISKIGASDSSEPMDIVVQTLPYVASDLGRSIQKEENVQGIVKKDDIDVLPSETCTVDEMYEQKVSKLINLENMMPAHSALTPHDAKRDIVVDFEESQVDSSKIAEDTSTTILKSPKYRMIQQKRDSIPPLKCLDQNQIQIFMKMLNSSSLCPLGGNSTDLIKQNKYFQIHLDKLEASRTMMYFFSFFMHQKTAGKQLSTKRRKYETDQVIIVPVASEVLIAANESTTLVENKDMTTSNKSKSQVEVNEEDQLMKFAQDVKPIQTERKREHGRLEHLPDVGRRDF